MGFLGVLVFYNSWMEHNAGAIFIYFELDSIVVGCSEIARDDLCGSSGVKGMNLKMLFVCEGFVV